MLNSRKQNALRQPEAGTRIATMSSGRIAEAVNALYPTPLKLNCRAGIPGRYWTMMKKTLIAVLMLSGALGAYAIKQSELDKRIHVLTSKFEAMQNSEKRIPADHLKRAQGIILLDRTKAGFLFAYQGGNGVAMVRDPQNGKWSPPAFVGANEASLGLQIGGQQSFVVILLMNTNATRLLTQSSFEFGGEAAGTAGHESGGVSGTISSDERPVLVYDSKSGLFGGVAIKGGATTPDDDANSAAYGEFMTMEDILFQHKVKPSDTALKLTEKLDAASAVAKK
jgi:lipid-binding SYLF domain-containing protein